MYGILEDEMKPGMIHALQMQTLTPEEHEAILARELAKEQAALGAR